MLVAVPVLLMGELLMELRFRMVVEQVGRASLLNDPDLARMDNTIRWVVRLRDSMLPELMIPVLVII